MSNTRNLFDRGTMTLFDDSVALAIRAESERDHMLSASLARSSLLATTLFLEACANTCLDMLVLERQFASDIDRLPLLTKFEVFLRLRFPDKQLDRSRYEVQCVVELKRVRDLFVHPKSHRLTVEITDEGSHTHTTYTTPTTNALNLPKIASHWETEHAVTAIKAAHGFLKYCFAEICELLPSQVSRILSSDEAVPNPNGDFDDDVDDDFALLFEPQILRWLEGKGVDLSYMSIDDLPEALRGL